MNCFKPRLAACSLLMPPICSSMLPEQSRISITSTLRRFIPFALFGLGGVVGLVGFIGWIVLMVAAHRGRYYKLPLFGNYAEQLANRISM